MTAVLGWICVGIFAVVVVVGSLASLGVLPSADDKGGDDDQ